MKTKVCILAAIASIHSAALAQHQRLTPTDMVRVTSIGDPDTLGWLDYNRQDADYSPDGTKIAVVLRWGDPDTGRYIARLLLFQAEKLEAAPRVVAEFRSKTNYQPIGDVRWTGGNTLVFGATDGRSPTQIFEADVLKGTIRPLTSEQRSIKWYDMSRDGRKLVAFAENPRGTPLASREDCIRSGCLVSDDTLSAAAYGIDFRTERGGQALVFDLSSAERRLLQTPDKDGKFSIRECDDNFSGGISPGGQYAIQYCRLNSWPSSWYNYTVDPMLMRALRVGNSSLVRQWFLVDLDGGPPKPLSKTPILFAGDRKPIWLDDHRVLLVGAVAPPAEAEDRSSTPDPRWGVVEIDVATGKQRTIFELPRDITSVKASTWNAATRTLCFQGRGSSAAHRNFVLGRRDGHWVESETDCPPQPRANHANRVFVRESLQDRPVLVSEDAASGKSKVILDPNKWLDKFDLGSTERVSWPSPDGRTWTGDLYLPPRFRKGVRYPVVVNPHAAYTGNYSIDWRIRSFPARLITARGVAVLQIMDASLKGVVATPAELPAIQQGVEAAIDYLDARKIVDRSRVGIMGWSRNGWHTNYLLTHSSYPFAAAMTIDSNDFGWFTYMAWGASREFEQDFGSVPFGPGLETWLEQAPSFNMDRIRAPLLMWDKDVVEARWDVYTGMRRLGLPVEYWFFPDGVHDLLQVRHRVTETELMADWFDFWLKGGEDPNPAKAEQYSRWRKLRELQNRALETPRPPLLDWQSRPLGTSSATN